MATITFMDKKFLQNKKHYDSALKVRKSLLELILKVSDPRNISFKEKLNMSNTRLQNTFNNEELEILENGITLYDFEDVDATMLHKLIILLCHLEEKDPELYNDLNSLKVTHDDVTNCQDNTIFTEFFIWQKIEALKELFVKILGRISQLYCVDVSDHLREIDENVDRVSKRVEVAVSEWDVKEFIYRLKSGIKCPFNVKVEIKKDPRYCLELDELTEILGKENIKIKLLINKSYFDGNELEFYDNKKHLLPLLDGSNNCKLVWYRGNLSNEMICMLPPSLEQLYIRVRPNQIENLNNQFHKLTKLWSLALYMDFIEDIDTYHMNTIDPSTLPVLKFKRKQFGIRICACISIDNIAWIVAVIKRLTEEHRCDTLEFYKTHLNTDHEIENLLRALHAAEIHVTTWVKLQNIMESNERKKDDEKRLSILAKQLMLGRFHFLAPW